MNAAQKYPLSVREIVNAAEKQAVARQILEALPAWFGIAEAREEYIRESGSLPVGAAFRNSRPVGFLALRETSPQAAEIYVMGVLPDCHRQGAGKALVEWAKGFCRKNGARFFTVKTLDASAESPEYAATRAFYRAAGFVELECFPTLWDEDNPCLVMIQTVEGAPSETGYASMLRQAEALVEGERRFIPNLANLSALIWQSFARINWAGFYLAVDGGLLLGPFQGKPACIRIPWGRGVCGTAAQRKQTLVAPDVHQFPGHIACDSASRSETVVPLLGKDGRVLGVLDVDSPEPDRFGPEEREALEALARLAIDACDWPAEG